MDSVENMASQLDEEFDHHLVSMKPYVLRLPHKSGKIKVPIDICRGDKKSLKVWQSVSAITSIVDINLTSL